MKLIYLILCSINTIAFDQSVYFVGTPEIFAPGIVNVGTSQVKVTFSKGGKLVLWGDIKREGGADGLDIWMAYKIDSVWSNPKPVNFNTSFNDFDPSFSADGNILYFFSNRPGGEGGDDIYFTAYDSITQNFGEPVNMGKNINTPGDEWGPAESLDGKKFMYCTDGRQGKGQHDIFICKKVNGEWNEPKSMDAINSIADDFDPVFLSDCTTIIFTRKLNDDEAYLYVTYLTDEGYSKPEKLDEQLNIPGTWNFGSSLSSVWPDILYYSTHAETGGQGRLDIYKVRYFLKKKVSK
jgi:Tol biopolymer transport system component